MVLHVIGEWISDAEERDLREPARQVVLRVTVCQCEATTDGFGKRHQLLAATCNTATRIRERVCLCRPETEFKRELMNKCMRRAIVF